MAVQYSRILYDPAGKAFRKDVSDLPFPAYASGNMIDINGLQRGAFRILEVSHTEERTTAPPSPAGDLTFVVHLRLLSEPGT